jgi:hypothetical protein
LGLPKRCWSRRCNVGRGPEACSASKMKKKIMIGCDQSEAWIFAWVCVVG